MWVSIKITRKDYMSINQCLRYVRESLEWETAMIKHVKHDNTIIENDKFSYQEFQIARN